MHWTAILARRRFPPDARVVGDLDCVGCGYNLRFARVGGVCPECGVEVETSLHELVRPDEVAAGYRAVARSYLPHFLLPLPLVISTFMGMDVFLLVGFILFLAACFRLWGSIMLRFRAALGQLPVIRPRLTAMFACHLVDVIMIASCCILWYAVMVTPPPLASVPTLKLMTGAAWLGLSLLGLLATSWAAIAVAGMLGYETCRRELIIHLVLIGTSPLSAILLMTAGLLLVMASGHQIGALVIRVVGGLSLIIIWAFGLSFAIVALLRLAGAALQERDNVDEDLVEADRDTLPHRTPPRPEQPDVKME